MRLTVSEKVYKFICYFFAIFVALCSFYPLLYSFFVSICSQQEWVARSGLLFFFPSHPTLAAYLKILGSGGYVAQAMGISVARSVVATVLSIFFNVCVGYVVSRPRLPGRNQIMALLIITILFSGGLIPGYLTVKQVGLLNSFWSMIIPGLINAWNVLNFKQFFEGVNSELEEAAEIDGAGEFKLMVRIIMPMSKPVIAAIGLFTFVGNWNSWFDAMIYIDAKHSYLWPLQLFTMINFNNMAQINSNPASIIGFITETQVMQISQKMALTIVTLLPVLIIYPFFQKYFTKGVYTGAVKG